MENQNNTSVIQNPSEANPSSTSSTENMHKKTRFPLIAGIVICILILIGSIGWIAANNASKQKNKVYRIGIIVGASPFTPLINIFKENMMKLGYTEGVNVVYDTQIFDNDPQSEKKALQKFVKDNVDLIFTLPTRPTEEAKIATKGTNIPVVFGAAGIEGTNLINSVGQPGGNITGVRIYSPDNTVKRLEILHQLAPKAKRINIIHTDYHTVPKNLEALNKAAPQMDVTLIETRVTSIAEAKASLEARTKSQDLGIDAILVLPEALMTSPDSLKVLGDFSAKYKIPVSTTLLAPNAENILFGYSLNFEEIGVDSAKLVDKVLRGTPAGTIPVYSPNPELWINYKVAQSLGLTVSEEILSTAKKVIR